MKPYYRDKAVTIYLGDMRELIGSLPKVAACITDPPYGETRLRWDTWPVGWVRLVQRIAPQMWCFGSLRMFWDRMREFEGWKLAQDVIWEKQNGSGLLNDRFRRVHEQVIHVYRGAWNRVHHRPVFTYDAKARNVIRACKPAHWGGISAGAYRVEENGPRLKRSVIYCKSMHRMGTNPTQKPEALIVPLMEYSVPPGGLVFDGFIGSGTVLAVAKKLGRRAIGIDADEKECEAAARRCQEIKL